MQFVAPEQHSLQQIQRLQALLGERIRSRNEEFFLAAQLVKHGHPAAGALIKRLKSVTSHPQALALIREFEGMSREINLIADLRTTLADRRLIERLYQTRGFNLDRGTARQEVLFVVCTTMYNNFGVSNAVFYAMLKQWGVSTLFLKDTTAFNYLKGVHGLGGNLREVAEGLRGIIRDNGFSKVYLLGYSSSTYASLRLSYEIPCTKYLGFSVVSDLTPASPRLRPKFFTAAVRSEIDQDDLFDLRPHAEARPDGVGRAIYFGGDFEIDARHADNLRGLPGYEIVEVSGCGHSTVERLCAEGKLFRIVRQLALDP